MHVQYIQIHTYIHTYIYTHTHTHLRINTFICTCDIYTNRGQQTKNWTRNNCKRIPQSSHFFEGGEVIFVQTDWLKQQVQEVREKFSRAGPPPNEEHTHTSTHPRTTTNPPAQQPSFGVLRLSSHTRMLTYKHTHACAHVHTHAHTLTQVREHTHTHTHTVAVPGCSRTRFV